MGKKSSSKKQKKLTANVASAVESADEKKLQEAQKTQLPFLSTKRIIATGIVVISLLILGFAGIFVWSKIIRANPLALYLSAEKTMAIVELDTQWEKPEWKEFFAGFPSQYVQKEYWTAQFEAYTNMNFDTQIKPWLGRKIGLALLSDFTPVIFFETKNEKKTIDFFSQFKLANVEEKIQKNEVDGVDVYSFEVGNGMTMAFFGNYLVVTSDAKSMKELIQTDSEKLLVDSKIYQQTIKNISSRNQIFAYINTQNLFQKTLGNISSDNILQNALHPILRSFQAQGWTAKMADGQLIIENENIINRPLIKFSKKYQAELLSLLPGKPDFFYGTENLRGEFDQLSDILSKQIVETFVTTELKKYVGDTISLQELLELFENEYLIARKDNQYQLLLKLSRPQEQEKKIQKALLEFKDLRPVFTPKVEGEIVIGNPETIQYIKKTYRNIQLQGLEIEGKPYGAYYAIIGNTAILATSLNMIEKSIDIWLDQKGSFADEDSHKKEIKNLIKTSDEIIFANQSILKNWLPEKYHEFLNTVDYGMSGWSYGENGIGGKMFIMPLSQG